MFGERPVTVNDNYPSPWSPWLGHDKPRAGKSSRRLPAKIIDVDHLDLTIERNYSITARNVPPGKHAFRYRLTDEFGAKSDWARVELVASNDDVPSGGFGGAESCCPPGQALGIEGECTGGVTYTPDGSGGLTVTIEDGQTGVRYLPIKRGTYTVTPTAGSWKYPNVPGGDEPSECAYSWRVYGWYVDYDHSNAPQGHLWSVGQEPGATCEVSQDDPCFCTGRWDDPDSARGAVPTKTVGTGGFGAQGDGLWLNLDYDSANFGAQTGGSVSFTIAPADGSPIEHGGCFQQ